MALTDKQRRFVDEYLLDLNATQAAIRAGYSEKTAYSQGQRLLKNVEVQTAMSSAQADRATRTKVDADWVLSRLADEADADIADLYTADGSLRPVHEWPVIWRKGLVAGIDVEEIKADGAVIGLVRKVKLSDRIKRIELIGKHVGVQAFRDQVQHSGAMQLTVSPEDAEL
ncbi:MULTISPECIES: terminase small subunit [unclassified Mesorhizobium]|uniref:terminase small subunit n=1 Tax=unclassified Mesorhizobium TaxID=325217 RepID=UPI00112C8331|nr:MULTISPECIES: terminase small subunit [unclassified Mesorhizobium]TPK59048.1 terminase small subunit [Mesorhizobium sp. B2-5-1]TPL06671.1 terminase small subunit [Mesorhizobium sp. B2-4-11]